MIRIEKTEVCGIAAALHGMRNPKNSWHLSDSTQDPDIPGGVNIGGKDYDLAMRLASAGPVHGKFRRMITVYADITAPMYWWSEYDTYKVGTVANSTSKMHKLLAKPFEKDDFSHDHIIPECRSLFGTHVDALNVIRDEYFLEDNTPERKKELWYTILQLLPNSYNQTRTVLLNYEVLANIYKYRRGHKLNEWRTFIDWIQSLPYSELITCDAGPERG